MAGAAGLFLGLWARNPLQIAAVCPSGEQLAAAMARLADLGRPRIVLELDAGTGSLTAGLLRSGCPPERLVAVECASFERLGPGGRFLQITNAFSSPLSRERLGITGCEAVRVWRNLPPAQTWTYRAQGNPLVQEMP